MGRESKVSLNPKCLVLVSPIKGDISQVYRQLMTNTDDGNNGLFRVTFSRDVTFTSVLGLQG